MALFRLDRPPTFTDARLANPEVPSVASELLPDTTRLLSVADPLVERVPVMTVLPEFTEASVVLPETLNPLMTLTELRVACALVDRVPVMAVFAAFKLDTLVVPPTVRVLVTDAELSVA